MAQRPRIPKNRDKDYEYAKSILDRGIYPRPAEFIKRLRALQTSLESITPTQVNQILAGGMRVLFADGINRFPEEHKNLIAVMAMVEALAAFNEELANGIMNKEPEKLKWRTGYRKWTDAGFAPDPDAVVNEHTISTEEKVLEALRDHFKDAQDHRFRILSAAAYSNPSRIKGKGFFHVQMPAALNFSVSQVSRGPFAELLQTSKSEIQIKYAGGGNVEVMLPEEATMQKFKFPRGRE